ncbi:MAG: protein phosphatase CheZ, partial [Deltaproteobacteria bacterium]|nr:protein phosphatase CheZ [Deltaproteobacteria bacterium]
EARAPVEPEPEVRLVKEYDIDPGVVFHTMYELCTNETVKAHIKAMGENCDANFNAAGLKSVLAEMAPTLPSEDNFFDFPLEATLKALFQHSTNEKFKQVLKKMSQTTATIFLDETLPIEGQVEEKEIVVEPDSFEISAPEPISASGQPGISSDDLEEILTRIQENIDLIEKEKAGILENADSDAVNPSHDSSLTVIKQDDRLAIVAVVEHSHRNLEAIIAHITRILETLSFQDLSGQRIMTIVRLITQVQIQLLSILVSFETKLKQRGKEENATSSEREKLAQTEVDQMLDRISSPLDGPGAENSLDQTAVDAMLDELGF